MFPKSKGDDAKLLRLARNMANSIDDVEKAQARADAANQVLGTQGGNPIADIFLDRVKELGGSVSQKYKLPASQLPNPKMSDGNNYKGKNYDSPILPIGSVDLETGECKYFNIYDTWDGTVEVWQVKRWGGTDNKTKLVFTAGDEPIEGIGQVRDFVHDQTGARMGTWQMIDYTRVKDMRGLIPLYGRKIFGYTYK